MPSPSWTHWTRIATKTRPWSCSSCVTTSPCGRQMPRETMRRAEMGRETTKITTGSAPPPSPISLHLYIKISTTTTTTIYVYIYLNAHVVQFSREKKKKRSGFSKLYSMRNEIKTPRNSLLYTKNSIYVNLIAYDENSSNNDLKYIFCWQTTRTIQIARTYTEIWGENYWLASTTLIPKFPKKVRTSIKSWRVFQCSNFRP